MRGNWLTVIVFGGAFLVVGSLEAKWCAAIVTEEALSGPVLVMRDAHPGEIVDPERLPHVVHSRDLSSSETPLDLATGTYVFVALRNGRFFYGLRTPHQEMPSALDSMLEQALSGMDPAEGDQVFLGHLGIFQYLSQNFGVTESQIGAAGGFVYDGHHVTKIHNGSGLLQGGTTTLNWARLQMSLLGFPMASTLVSHDYSLKEVAAKDHGADHIRAILELEYRRNPQWQRALPLAEAFFTILEQRYPATDGIDRVNLPDFLNRLDSANSNHFGLYLAFHEMQGDPIGLFIGLHSCFIAVEDLGPQLVDLAQHLIATSDSSEGSFEVALRAFIQTHGGTAAH